MFHDEHQPMQLITEYIQKLAEDFCGVPYWGEENGDSAIKAIEILNVIDRDHLPLQVIERTIHKNAFLID